MAKIFYTEGTGAQQTLNESDSNKIKVYDDYDSIDTSELVDGQIVSTKETSADGSNVYDYVNEQIEDAVATSQSYSTEEQLTGGKWIDGKPIYRKVWNIQNFTDNISLSGGLSNVETVIKMYGTSYNVADSIYSQFPRNSAGNYFSVVYQVSTDTIIFANYSGYNGSKVLLIMEYTKTTD